MAEHIEAETDGDNGMIIKTAFGTARLELSDDPDPANENLLSDDDDEWPDDFALAERWDILVQEVEVALQMYRGDEV